MKKEEIISVLKEDEKEGNGEILDEKENHVSYFDYNDDMEIDFHFEETCTDEYVKSLIHIGKGAVAHGLKHEYVIDVLKKAFADDYYDAICTCAGIIIPSNETEFKDMLQKSFRTGDVVDEWYDYDEQEDVVGRMFTAHQIVFINESKIASMAKELGDEIISEDEEYETGIVMTLIHEMRHLMIDTNPFLPEEMVPVNEASEDAVEEFCRNKFESLGELKRFR